MAVLSPKQFEQQYSSAMNAGVSHSQAIKDISQATIKSNARTQEAQKQEQPKPDNKISFDTVMSWFEKPTLYTEYKKSENKIRSNNQQLDALNTAGEYFTGYSGMTDDELNEQLEVNKKLLAASETTFNVEQADAARAAIAAIEAELNGRTIPEALSEANAEQDAAVTEMRNAGYSVNPVIDTIAGAAKQTGGQMQSAFWTLLDNTRRGALDFAEAGLGPTEAVQELNQQYSSPEAEAKMDERYAAADKKINEGEQEIARVKNGRSAATQFLVDLGVGGIQLAGDMALGAINPALATAALATRTFGGGAHEAREAGADDFDVVLTGIASAGKEVILNKLLGGLGKVYGKSKLAGVTDKVWDKIAKNPKVAGVLKAVFNTEGAEEMLSGLIDPAIRAIYSDKGLAEYSELELSELLYQGLVGQVLGAGATGVEVAANFAKNGNLDTQMPKGEKSPQKASDTQGDNQIPPSTTEMPTSRPDALNNAEQPQQNVNAADILVDVAMGNKNTAPQQGADSTAVNTDPRQHTPVEQAVINEYQNSVVNGAGYGQGANASNNSNSSDYSYPEGQGNVRERGYLQSSRTDANTEAELRAAIEQDTETYRQLSNADTAAKAEAIFAQGVDNARIEVEKALADAANGKKVSPEIVPLTHLVTNALTKRGDIETAKRLRAQLAAELTAAGQFNQAVRIMRRTDPETVRKMIGTALRKINSEVGGRTKAKQEAADVAEDINIAVATATQNVAQTISAPPKIRRSKSGGAKADDAKPDAKNTNIVFTFEYADEGAKAISKAIEAKIKPRAERKKTAMETLVDSAKRYMLSGIKSPTGKTKANPTATELFADYASNPEYYASLWRNALEQLRAKHEGMSGTGTRELLASAAIERDGGIILRRAMAESAVAMGENASFIRKQAAAGVAPENIANAIANDLISKSGATGAIAEAVRQQAADYVDNVLSNGQADSSKIVLSAMRDIGETLSNLALSTERQRQTAKEAITYLLAEKYAFSPTDAESIGALVQEQLNAAVKAQAEKMLAARYGANTPQAKKTKPIVDKVIEAVNLGAFNSEYATAAANKIFGFDKISTDSWMAQLTAEEEQLIANTDFTEDGAFEKVYEQIAKRLGAEMPVSKWEQLTELRRINMLLRPRSLIKNVVGNLPMKVLRKGAERLSAEIQKALPAEQRTRGIADSNQKLLAREYFAEHGAEILETGDKWDINSLVRKYKTVFKDGKITAKLSELSGKELHNVLEGMRQLTYNALKSGDAPFMRSAFVDSLSQYMAAQGINSADGITQDAIDFAMANALEATFQNANVVATALNSIKRNADPAVAMALDVLLPFTTTPTNILAQTVKYSPAGLASALGKMVKQGATASNIDALSKGIVGSAVLALGWALRSLGLITGGEDEDKDKAALDKATGNNIYSIGGKISYDWAQPVGSLLALGAEFSDAISEQESWASAVANAFYTAGDSLLNMSLFQNVMSVLKGSGKPTQQIIDAIIEGGATQLIPGLAGDIAKLIDGTVRSTYTGGNVFDDAKAKMQANTPFASTKLPASINVKGEANTRGGFGERAINTLLNPATMAQGNRTAVDDEVYRILEETGSKTHFPSVSPYSVEFDGETFKMNGKEREQFQTTQGQAYYDVVDDLIKNAAYKKASPIVQRDILEDVRDYALALAKDEFLASKGKKYEWPSKAAETTSRLSDPAKFLAETAIAKANAEKKGETFSTDGRDALAYYATKGFNNGDMDKLADDMLGKRQGKAYDAFRAAKVSPKETMELFTQMDGENQDGKYSQPDVFSALIGHPKLSEEQKSVIWANTQTGSTDWATYLAKHR